MPGMHVKCEIHNRIGHAMKNVLTLIGEFIAAASLFLIPVALSYLGCGLGYTCP